MPRTPSGSPRSMRKAAMKRRYQASIPCPNPLLIPLPNPARSPISTPRARPIWSTLARKRALTASRSPRAASRCSQQRWR
eukprot:37771-Eustigmatos_ZCMA.PRE.1